MPTETKTNLTNTAVQESAESVSSRQQAGDRPGLNGTEKDEKGIPWENRAKEYESKYTTMVEKHSELEEKIQELEGKLSLTAAEQARLAKLEGRKDNLEEQMQELESNPQYKPFYASIDKRDQKVKEEAKEAAKFEIMLELQRDFLEEKAEETGMDYKKFVKELAVFEGRYADKNPVQRAKLCLRDWNKAKDLEKREAALKAKEAEKDTFVEGEGRTPKESTLDEAFQKGDMKSAMRKLGL